MFLCRLLPASLLEQWQQDCHDRVKRAELERWLADLPEGELLVDTFGNNQFPDLRIMNDEQKKYYSGKHKEAYS